MRWLVLVVLLAVGGCSTDLEPGPAELRARWDAQNTYPARYKSDLVAFMRTWLNEPEHVRGAAVSPPQLKKVGAGDRFVTCVRYNPRGGDGQYAGVKTGAASYVSGKLDRFFDTPKSMVDELCKDVAFAPFPELEKLTR